jgi:glycosyl transferase family 25
VVVSKSSHIPIYIINLARESRRKAFMQEQLDRLELQANFVEAIDARQLSVEELSSKSDAAAVKRSPSWLSPGAIACGLSHSRAYHEFIASGQEAALFLEDDTVLSGKLKGQLEELIAEIKDQEVILLHFVSFAPCELRINGGIPFGPYGATAIKLAEYTSTVKATADAWGHFMENGMIDRVRCTAPSIILTADFKSSIDYIKAGSLKGKLLSAVDRWKIFPFYQILARRRRKNVELVRDSFVFVD